MKGSKLIIGSLVLIIAGFVGATYLFKAEETKKAITNRIPMERLVKAHSPWIGVETAKVVVVEYLDPECEACAAHFPMVKGLVSDYKDRIKFVVRYMLFHGSSKEAAIATEAAGRQGKYWEMQAQLFFRKDWTHSEKVRFDIFEDIAKNLGMDVVQFKKDMKDPALEAFVVADYEEGKAIGVRGTPTVYVNGVEIANLSYEALKARIDEELTSFNR